MWDGRARGLARQIAIPLEGRREMNIDWTTALDRLQSEPATQEYLHARDLQRVDKGQVVGAIAAYLRTLVSGGSPFDRYYFAGDENAVSQEAKDGFKLFVYKGQCATCHLITGQAAPFTDSSFHVTGVGFANGKYADVGRFAVTGKPEDEGAFKTPSLRNVAERKFYMHDGSMDSLLDVIKFYNSGGPPRAPNKDARLRPLFLSDAEMKAMVSFLQTLTAPIEIYRPQDRTMSK
jgi:cytochrome c peroxidase